MSKIVTKRNAFLGWVTWHIGKRIARKKAQAAVPKIEGNRPNRPAIAAAIAAAGGALVFWHKRRGSGASDAPE